MSGAKLVSEEKFVVYTAEGKALSFFMDLYRIAPPHHPSMPEGYKFSWIAFEPETPKNRVLFDCHPPKGPHMHLDDDSEGLPFIWESLEKSRKLFFSKVVERFGKIPLLEGVLK